MSHRFLASAFSVLIVIAGYRGHGDVGHSRLGPDRSPGRRGANQTWGESGIFARSHRCSGRSLLPTRSS